MVEKEFVLRFTEAEVQNTGCSLICSRCNALGHPNVLYSVTGEPTTEELLTMRIAAQYHSDSYENPEHEPRLFYWETQEFSGLPETPLDFRVTQHFMLSLFTEAQGGAKHAH